MSEETISNTSRPFTRSQTSMMEKMISSISPSMEEPKTYPFDRIPLNLKEEILMKMKAKHISKLISLSKYWSSIVCSKYFADLYLTRSSTRPQMLFSIHRRDVAMQFLHSVSQEDPSSDDQETVSCYPQNPNKFYNFSPPVRGLICCLNEKNKVMIGNPSTDQFVTLPRVKTFRKDIFCFFGYDPVGNVYKVLCMTVSRRRKRGSTSFVSEEHQVFTLGAKKEKWRKIECNNLQYYTPRGTQGICSNGVVYYRAMVNGVWSLICFDVGSETFSAIKLPADVLFPSNYGDKIAVSNLVYDGTSDLWVLEDASKKDRWSKVSIVIPSWTSFFRFPQTFKFRGILAGTGELVFAPCFCPHLYFLLCYDLKEKKARKLLIQSVGNIYSSLDVFLNHVESPMFLQI